MSRGSGTPNLVFAYTIQAGENDSNGISVRPNSLSGNGGSIQDPPGSAANLAHGPVGSNASFIVDTTAPTLSSSTPADNASDVPRGDNIILTFDDDVQAGNGNIVISGGLDTRTISVTDGSQISISGHQVTIDPTFDLLFGTTYTLQIGAGVLTDAAGNSSSTTFEFRTADVIPLPLTLALSAGSDSFQSLGSESTDIRAAANDATTSAASNSALWSGSANLGSEDRVMVVSADSWQPPVPAKEVSIAEAGANGQSLADIDAKQRAPSADTFSLDGSLPGASHDGLGGHIQIAAFGDMPVALLTSQGLAS